MKGQSAPRPRRRLPIDRRRGERGAGTVEFAMALPLLLVILTGVVTGGISLNRDISLNNAAREGARYGATLPVADMTAFLDSVANVAINAATGELDDGEAGRVVCVAYVHPDGTDVVDRTTRLVVDVSGVRTVTVGAACHTDSRPDDERRVQVDVARTSDFEVVFWSRTVTLEGSSTARYERAGF